MNNTVSESEPNPNSGPVREWINPNIAGWSGSLAETRKMIDGVDQMIFDNLAPLLAFRIFLTDDAVRFKENLEQVTAIERQTEKLVAIDEMARNSKHIFPPDLMVDVFDAIITFSVERQRQLFDQTKPVEE